MAVTTIFAILPFAIIAVLIYSYLVLDFSRIYCKVKNKFLRIFLYVLTYLFMFVFISISLSFFALLLLLGLIGIPLLIILDIVGIVLIIIRIVKKIRNKKNSKNEVVYLDKIVVDLEKTIKDGYKKSASKYDDYITSSKLWSKIFVSIVWGFKDEEYVKSLLPLLPDNFTGNLLDIPTGTAIFTAEKYKKMKVADIFCVDYSEDMLKYAIDKFEGAYHISCQQGDVGNLVFEDNFFDIVFSMNGFHAFPDKDRAFGEVSRVLKVGGKFIGCFYIKGERRFTDFFVKQFFVKGGTFTPPFMTKEDLEVQLQKDYKDIRIWNVKSIVCFECVKK